MNNYDQFGWGVDGYGNKHMTLDGRHILFVVMVGECMYDAIDDYLNRIKNNE